MWQQDKVMGFLLCSQDIRKKSGRTQQGECHSLARTSPERGSEIKKEWSHLFTKRIMAMWPQSVWLR